jgi:ATP-dependent exoDNAse (exonuclease V) beta subunit
VHDTLTAPLQLSDGGVLPPMIAATALAREVEFSYPIPAIPGASRGLPRRGMVKGYIDALVAYDDDLWVLDYKSDVLALAGPGSGSAGGATPDLGAAALHRVREHYAIQARLYAIAADRIRGRRRFAGLLFAFIRYGIVVPVRVGDETLAAWQDWLGRIATVAPEVRDPRDLREPHDHREPRP